MKKSIFFFLVLLSSGLLMVSKVLAQNFSIGARGGISIPNLTAGGNEHNPLNTGYSSRFGPDGGLYGEYAFSSLFSLQVMVEYSSQGGKKNGLQAFTTPDQIAASYPTGEAPPYLYANYKSEAKINYLMIPILAKFGWDFKGSRWRLYVDGGPFVGILLNARQVTSGESPFYADPQGEQALPIGAQSFDNTQNIKGDLHSTNVGFEGNIGLNYRIKASNIFLEVGGNYGFLNIQKGAANGKNNTGAATACLGYSYRLGRRH